MRRPWLAGVLTIAVCGLTACATTSDDNAQIAVRALSPTTAEPPSTTTTTLPPVCRQPFDATVSYAPMQPLPSPGAMPLNTFMATIQAKGYITVGVDENTLYFSYRTKNGIEGFEADLAYKIAESIFGDSNPERVRFKTVVTDEKVDVVAAGEVDMTISVVSANCPRWQLVSFSSPYYLTRQRILVRGSTSDDSEIKALADLNQRKVCVTRTSSSESYLNGLVEDGTIPDVRIKAVEARTDCLVLLQEGRVDAILLPNSILAGLHVQDPMATTFAPVDNLRTQSYGIPINKKYPEFVSFVNGLLQQWRLDGTLDRLRSDWIAEAPDLATDTFAPEPPAATR